MTKFPSLDSSKIKILAKKYWPAVLIMIFVIVFISVTIYFLVKNTKINGESPVATGDKSKAFSKNQNKKVNDYIKNLKDNEIVVSDRNTDNDVDNTVFTLIPDNKIPELTKLKEMYASGVPDVYDASGRKITGVEPDPNKTEFYTRELIKVDEDNRLVHMIDLARYYHQGMHGTAPDYDQAISIYNAILEQPDLDEFTISRINDAKKDAEKNLYKAYDWLNLRPKDEDGVEIEIGTRQPAQIAGNPVQMAENPAGFILTRPEDIGLQTNVRRNVIDLDQVGGVFGQHRMLEPMDTRVDDGFRDFDAYRDQIFQDRGRLVPRNDNRGQRNDNLGQIYDQVDPDLATELLMITTRADNRQFGLGLGPQMIGGGPQMIGGGQQMVNRARGRALVGGGDGDLVGARMWNGALDDNFRIPAQMQFGGQNVHDHMTVANVRKSLKNLGNERANVAGRSNLLGPTTTGPNRNGAVDDLRQILASKPDSDKIRDAKEVLTFMVRNNEHNVSLETNDIETLNSVYNRIQTYEPTMRATAIDNLINEMSEMKENGHVVCSMGRISRIVDAINVIDPDVKIVSEAMVDQEMLTKSSKIRSDFAKDLDKSFEAGTHPDQDRLDGELKQTIRTELHKDYDGIINKVELDSKIDKWIDHI